MSNENPGLMYLRDDKNTELILKVKRENISTERNFKINEQEMYSNKSNHHTTGFYDNGDDGLSFACTLLFHANEENTFKTVDAWYTQKHPFNIVFGKLINLKLPLVSKKWIITKLSMKQEVDDITEWEATFRTYNPPKDITKVSNDLVNRTTKSYKWKSKCKKSYKNLNYKTQKKKKFPKSDCAKLLNSIMIELGYMRKVNKTVKTGKKDKKGKAKTTTKKVVPDTYTSNTAKAVKKFKKNWNKRKLKPAFKANKKGQYNDTLTKTGFENISNYKKLKSSKKKK